MRRGRKARKVHRQRSSRFVEEMYFVKAYCIMRFSTVDTLLILQFDHPYV